MKVKQLKDLLSKMNEDEDILFDRYDHFLEEYECYDFNNIIYNNKNNIIELKRLKEKDNSLLESPDTSYDEEEKEIEDSEILDDMMDENFSLVANL